MIIQDMSIEYRIDERNRVVIAEAYAPLCTSQGCCVQQIAKAKARCVDSDTFDVQYGKKLARTRVLIKVNKLERQICNDLIEEAKQNLKNVCAEMDKVNNNLIRYQRKLADLGVER